MKKLTKIGVVVAAVLLIGATSVTALAASGSGSRNMMAGYNYSATVNNNTTTNDPAELEALKAQRLEQMKAVLDARVAAGTMTQTQADELLDAMKERQAACLGTGTGNGYGMMGPRNGTGCGMTGKPNGVGCGMNAN